MEHFCLNSLVGFEFKLHAQIEEPKNSRSDSLPDLTVLTLTRTDLLQHLRIGSNGDMPKIQTTMKRKEPDPGLDRNEPLLRSSHPAAIDTR